MAGHNKKDSFLNPRRYEFDELYDKIFAKQDLNIISIICMLVFVIMFGTLMLVLFVPDLRYDSGMDNMPKLIIFAGAGLFGFFLAFLLSKRDIKTIKLSSYQIATFYYSLLFLSLSCYEFLLTDAKADAIFVYLMYAFGCVVLLHMNPISYTIQTIIYLALTFKTTYEYFDSVGTVISYFGLLGSTVFLAFYVNFSTRRKIKSENDFALREKFLQDEINNKQSEIIENIRDHTEMQENIIIAIADLVESRDMDTGSHIKATSYYAKLIADGCLEQGVYLDLIDEDFSELIFKAAPMHDLGKIAIPDNILKAPRRLTDQEFEIMKTHTVEGAKIIKHIYQNIENEEYITCAANIAHYHHERWDGTGYPEKLSGNDIPIEARIMAVADVFDALVSKRCYKDSYPMSKAFEEIYNNAGSQFDPKLVKIFLSYKDIIENMIVGGFEGLD